MNPRRDTLFERRTKSSTGLLWHLSLHLFLRASHIVRTLGDQTPVTETLITREVSENMYTTLTLTTQNMPDFALTPVSTGKIFCSTYDTFLLKGRIPTTPLPHDHPFWNLWEDHRSSLLQPGNSDTVIDALIAIEQGSPTWKEHAKSKISAKQKDMRQILSCHPPDIVLLLDMGDYGFHHRQKRLWPYICINEDYVNSWIFAKNNTKEHLSLTALLRASLDHELGHWIQTLVNPWLIQSLITDGTDMYTNNRKQVMKHPSRQKLSSPSKNRLALLGLRKRVKGKLGISLRYAAVEESSVTLLDSSLVRPPPSIPYILITYPTLQLML
jgi:hypothetical protein